MLSSYDFVSDGQPGNLSDEIRASLVSFTEVGGVETKERIEY